MFYFDDKDQLRRIISLFVLIFSAVGFRLFQFSASLLVWMLIILLLNFNNVLKIPFRAWFVTFLLIIILYVIFLIKGAQFPYFLAVAILTSLFGLSNYISNNYFYSDFSKLLKFYMIYALVSVVILIFFRNFFNEITLGYSRYYTFQWLFWYNDNGGPLFFGGLRPCGFTWEVGIWQLFLNFNFLFSLHENRSKKSVFLAILAANSVFSTTGIFLSCFVILVHFFLNMKSNKFKIVIPFFFFVLAYPLLFQNVEEKINGVHSASGMTRVADLFIGLNLLFNSPIWGADQDLATATNNTAIWNLKEKFWSGSYTDGAFDYFMEVPNSNGLIIFLLDWGLPIGLLLLFFTFRNKLFNDSKLTFVFMATFCFSIFSEAISRTSFFYFFILASLLIKYPKPSKK